MNSKKMKIRIKEMDQTIVPTQDLEAYIPHTKFIADLIEEAKKTGEATREDAEGCPVTCIIEEEE